MLVLSLLLSAHAEESLPRGYRFRRRAAPGLVIGGASMAVLSGSMFVLMDRSAGGDSPANVVGITFLSMGGAGYAACSLTYSATSLGGARVLSESGYDVITLPGKLSVAMSSSALALIGAGIALDQGALTRSGLALSVSGWVTGALQHHLSDYAAAEGPQVSLMLTPDAAGLTLRWNI